MEKGLINALDESPLDKALEWSREVNQMAPLAVRAIKENARKTQSISFTQSLEVETDSQREMGNSQDYKEGLRAFLAKQSPQFMGH